MTHGTRSGYNNGCRCPLCTEANTAASRARRERIAGLGGGVRTPVVQPIRTPAAVRMTAPVPVAGPTQPVVEGPKLLGPIATHPSSNSFGKRPVGRINVAQSAGRDDWDMYAQLLRLYLAGVGRSPSLLALAAETEAYYSVAEDRSGLGPTLPTGSYVRQALGEG